MAKKFFRGSKAKKPEQPRDPEESKEKSFADSDLDRFIEHDFQIEDEEEYIEQKKTEIREQLEPASFNLETHLTPDSFEMITSQGDEFKDPGIYVGTGGLLLYFYKKIKYLQMMREDLEETKESFDICFETNLELWKHQKMSKKQIPSFFMGMPGILTIGYLFYHEFGNESRAYE